MATPSLNAVDSQMIIQADSVTHLAGSGCQSRPEDAYCPAERHKSLFTKGSWHENVKRRPKGKG